MALYKPMSCKKQPPGSNEFFIEFFRAALIAFVYFIAVRIGILFAVKPEGIASIWFPSGVALAALLLTEKRKWAVTLLVIFSTNAAGNMAGGNTLPVSLCFALANSIEPALGAWIFSYFFKSKITFTNIKEVLVLCGIAVLSNGITASLGAAVPFFFFEAPFFDTWVVWWVADGLGIIMITPVIIAWTAVPFPLKSIFPYRVFEIGVLFAGIVVFMLYPLPFYPSEAHQYLHFYSIFPLLIWAALRFGPRGTITTIFAFSIILLWDTIHGFGGSGLIIGDLKRSLLIIQTLIIIITPAGLILAAAISESKNLAARLLESEEGYRVLVEGTEDLVSRVDHEGKFIFINQASEKIFGLKPEECIGLSAFDFIHPDDREMTKQIFDGWIQNKIKSSSIENRQVSRTGEIFNMLWASTPLYDKSGHMIGVNGIARDITKRKQTEEVLKRIKDMLNETEKIGKVGGWEFNIDTGKQTWTEETYRIHEVDSTFGPTVEKGVSFYTPHSRPIIERAVKQAIEHGEPFDLELEIITAKDNLRSVHVIGQADKENRRIYGFFQDITLRKQVEKKQENLQKELYKAHKLESVGTLAGGIAHDFNNLLYVVMGNISLALDDLKPDTEISEYLKEAEKACIKAKELSAQLITFSKGGDPVKKRMPINGLLKDTVFSTLGGSNIIPEISIPDDIRQVYIDEGQIKQVVRNIVVNAKEAMNNNGQLTVSCENVDIPEKWHLKLNQGEYIRISFKDQGCGILKENLDKIFDPYFSTKDMGTGKGQGLGLTVCYSIVQKHDGLIHVDSEPQIGSTFSVYLPAFSFKNHEFQNLKKKQTEHELARKPAAGTKKILLMDDEEAIRAFIGQIINRLGYAVETCAEGKEALEIYTKAMESKEPFDLVILDLTNKIGMGGQETMKKLLELDPDVKGIIITGYSDDPVVTNFRDYGFSGFIKKPATRDELSKVINEAIS